MKIERVVTIEGEDYTVVISDETEALLAAKAAGRAVLGLMGSQQTADWPKVSYLVESLDEMDEEFLEQVVRRHLGLPWTITETKRLVIREFQPEDADKILREESDTDADRIFYDRESLKEYIRCQYGFYEFGLWALVEKETGVIVGKAGLSCWEGEPEDDRQSEDTVCLELGYHIFTPYRRKGYAVEACQAILDYAGRQWESCIVYAKIDASNEASIRVAESCGFIRSDQTCSGALQYSYPCESCC